MRDPNPENIAGRKVQVHEFSHEIQWGYVVLGLLGLFVAWKLFGGISFSSEDDREESDNLRDIRDSAEAIWVE